MQIKICPKSIKSTVSFRLTDDVRDELIKLIAIDADSQREHHANLDSFCQIAISIKKGERRIQFA